MDGILIVDKPAGMTSHDVVARARRILRTKSIGHTGTLDPFATGVIVLLVGRATRLARFLDKDQKEYEALVRFGYETETGDLTGSAKREVQSAKSVSIEEVEQILPEFRGEIWQTPPMYSAKKIAGRKLYELARKGIEVERQAVKVNIYELRITNYELRESVNDLGLETCDLELKVVCSAGTYIRTLAEDVGKKMKTGAHLAALRRTRAGRFDLSQSVTLEEMETLAAANKISEKIVSMNKAVAHLPEKRLSAEEIAKVKNGTKLLAGNEIFTPNSDVRLTDENDNLLAIGLYDAEQNFIQPKLVLL